MKTTLTFTRIVIIMYLILFCIITVSAQKQGALKGAKQTVYDPCSILQVPLTWDRYGSVTRCGNNVTFIVGVNGWFSQGQIEFSTDNITWADANFKDPQHFSYTHVIEKDKCRSFWARIKGCPQSAIWGCYYDIYPANPNFDYQTPEYNVDCNSLPGQSSTVVNTPNNPCDVEIAWTPGIVTWCAQENLTIFYFGVKSTNNLRFTAEFSTNGSTWSTNPELINQYVHPHYGQTPGCTPFWARVIGCPSKTLFGCYFDIPPTERGWDTYPAYFKVCSFVINGYATASPNKETANEVSVVFPNPTSSSATISFFAEKDATVALSLRNNMTGEIVYQTSIIGNGDVHNEVINLNDLKQAEYIVLIDNGQKIVSKRIVKQ